MYSEDDYIQLSALQHYLFCPRQCALAYMEHVWEENMLTAQGHLLHERVDTPGKEKRKDVLQLRGVYISSRRLGLSGKADEIECVRDDNSPDAVSFPAGQGKWRFVPVEFKRGKPKQNACDAIQLCAQGFCIEEMLSTVVSTGYIYYGSQKRRMTVEFDSALRTSTEETAEQVHALLASGKTPEPVNDSRCRNCSMLRLCLPQQVNKNTSDYIEKKVFDV